MYYEIHKVMPNKLTIVDRKFNYHNIKIDNFDNCKKLFEELIKYNTIANTIKNHNDALQHTKPLELYCLNSCFSKYSCNKFWNNFNSYVNKYINIKCKIERIDETIDGYSLHVVDDNLIKNTIIQIPSNYINDINKNDKIILKSILNNENNLIFTKYSELMKIIKQ